MARRPRETLDGQAAIEHGWRTTNTSIAEAVRTLAAQAPGDSFIREFLPHHERFVVDGMRLNAQRLDEAITFLARLRDHLEHHCPTCGQCTTGEAER